MLGGHWGGARPRAPRFSSGGAGGLGMGPMAAAGDLVMLYLAIETTSIPLYLLAGYLKRDTRSTEAGLKYFLFGAAASTVMLYGFSLIFGFTGETRLAAAAPPIVARSM